MKKDNDENQNTGSNGHNGQTRSPGQEAAFPRQKRRYGQGRIGARPLKARRKPL